MLGPSLRIKKTERIPPVFQWLTSLTSNTTLVAIKLYILTHLSLVSLLADSDHHCRTRSDAAKRREIRINLF